MCPIKKVARGISPHVAAQELIHSWAYRLVSPEKKQHIAFLIIKIQTVNGFVLYLRKKN